jgi:hypothetical protein
MLSRSIGYSGEYSWLSASSLSSAFVRLTLAAHVFTRQELLDIFSEKNPAGNITTRDLYCRSIAVCIAVGVLVSFKRVWLGYHLGCRICGRSSTCNLIAIVSIDLRSQYVDCLSIARYNEDLRVLMEKLIILSEVASLSVLPQLPPFHGDLEDSSVSASQENDDESSRLGNLGLLEDWYEPVKFKAFEGVSSLFCYNEARDYVHISNHMPRSPGHHTQGGASIKEILEFRQAVLLMQTEFPFSRLFGSAKTREACVGSSAEVYKRLVGMQSSRDVLQFATLSEIAINGGGAVDKVKMRKLIQLFRPNKDKVLTLLDFTEVRTRTIYNRHASSSSHKNIFRWNSER